MPAVPTDLPSHQVVGHEICKTLTLSSPGPHALLLCIPATELANCLNYTNALKPYQKLFGDDIYDFVIIVLTRFDEVKHEGSSTLRKETNINDEFKYAVANNTVLKKIDNVMNNKIILEARLSRDEKDMKWKEVIGVIKKTRTRRKDRGKREFASCNLTEVAEIDLQKQIQKETAVGSQSLRDKTKKNKHHLDHVCSR
ncbi:GTPase IMAP family member 4-like [Mytilus trossulus]|uniref:GTPase IMAP family member 4-like n=1 Tax=Mytilus trossulus TaxID=6551 RepID=UPI0030052B88